MISILKRFLPFLGTVIAFLVHVLKKRIFFLDRK